MVLNETKFKDETLENIQEMFQYIFMLIGLKSIPNEMDTVFLLQEIKEEYGNHPISELKLAFKKAIKGELDIDPKDVKCYDNFSMAYVAPIMSAYRKWASQEFRRFEQFIPPSESDQKLLQGPPPDKHFGRELEQAYQHFLSFGEEHNKFFPAEFYNQLVKDDLVAEDLFRKAMVIVRKKVIHDLQVRKTLLETKKFGNTEKNDRAKFAESINRTNVSEVDKKIAAYKTGEGDGELELLAKQYCVIQYFKKSKVLGKNNIYIKQE